jgi:hypothetical protein
MKVLLAIAFLLCDVAVGSFLVIVLLRREYSGSDAVEWALSRRRRRRWTVLITLAGLSYFSLAPVFLALLIHLMRQ